MLKTFTLIFLSCLLFSLTIDAQHQLGQVAVLDFELPSKREIQAAKKADAQRLISLELVDFDKLSNLIASFQDYVTEIFMEDPRFTLVERSKYKYIEEERELQKSEEFIDGYVVEQFKSIGANYLVLGKYNLTAYTLTIRILNVSDGNFIGQEIVELKKNIKFTDFSLSSKPGRKKIQEATVKLIAEAFPSLKYPVVKADEVKKTKVESLLIAAGSKHSIRAGTTMEIIEISELEVEGEKLKRETVVGSGLIDLVENANFSILKIVDGQKELKLLLDAGKKLYCRPLKTK